MQPCRIYLSGYTPALAFAAKELTARGFAPTADLTSATHLLLPVPSFDTDGTIKGGGKPDYAQGRLTAPAENDLKDALEKIFAEI